MFLVLVLAFVAHLAAFGAWVVDDAGISFAYASNLAHGHGLVAQPGAIPVEGFSNPLWVFLLALMSRVGLLGRGGLFGIPGYVVITKGLAVVLHGVVLVCVGLSIRRLLEMVRGGDAPLGLTMGCWAASGLLLAANPSYVIWMGSGLENPLLAAEVAAIAAVAVHAVPYPTRRSMIGLGALCGLAALTRPDGIIYASVLGAVALLSVSRSWGQRWSTVWPGLAVFGVVFGPYLAFRRLYFGAWLPNTAVAKGQKIPTSDALVARGGQIVSSFGWPLTSIAVLGAAVAIWTMHRHGNTLGIRVVGAGATVLLAAVAAFLVLLPDWMGELRFLTPVWPLLSAAAILAIVQLVAVHQSRHRKATFTVLLSVLAVVALPNWWERTQSFRTAPTLPLCYVAQRYGQQFNTAARTLGLNPSTTSVLLPDLGGTLLVSHLKVIDLAGLTNPHIARFWRDRDQPALVRFVLDDLRPTFIHTHAYWTLASGLNTNNPQMNADYIQLTRGQDWVRRDAVASTHRLRLVKAQMKANIATARRLPAGAACGNIFG